MDDDHFLLLEGMNTEQMYATLQQRISQLSDHDHNKIMSQIEVSYLTTVIRILVFSSRLLFLFYRAFVLL